MFLDLFSSMHKTICIAIVVLLSITQANAQGVNMNGGQFQISESGKGMSNSNLSKGMIDHVIPITSLSSTRLNSPVSLRYYSTGTRVYDVASSVGLGWNLQAGGAITRIVRDDPDEESEQAYPEDIEALTQETVQFALDATDTEKDFDTEPDLFSYQFGGYSGTFVIDNNGDFVTIPYQNIRFKPNEDWTVITVFTPDGMIYEFGGEKAIEYSLTNNDCNSSASSEYVKSAWKLKSTKHPIFGSITYNYNMHEFTYLSGNSKVEYELLSSTIPDYHTEIECISFDTEKCKVFSSLKSPLLENISIEGYGNISFKYSERMGSGPLKLDEIISFDHQGLVLDKLEFQYCYSRYDKMFLSAIKVLDSNSGQTGAYSFDYYDINKLPYGNNIASDHWGYYNGSNVEDIPREDTNEPFNYNAEYRQARGEYAKLGMLKSITYPTALIENFEYESNIASDGYVTGGVRISKVERYDPIEDRSSFTRYFYGPMDTPSISSSIEFHRPSFETYFNQFKTQVEDPIHECVFYECSYESFHYNSLQPLNNTLGDHLIYEYVTVSNGENFENGGVEYAYFTDAPDSDAELLYGEYINNVPLTNSGWRNGKLRSKKVFKKQEESIIVLSKEEYSYTSDERKFKAIPAYSIRETFRNNCSEIETITCTSENNQQVDVYFCRSSHQHDLRNNGYCIANGAVNKLVSSNIPPCYGYASGEEILVYLSMNNIDMMRYNYESHWVYLDEIRSTQYDENGNNPIESVRKYYFENPSHCNLNRAIVNLGEQGAIETIYRYPQDYEDPADNLSKLIEDFRISTPIEVIQKRNNVLLSANAVKYGIDESGNNTPKEIYYLQNKNTGFEYSSNGMDFDSYALSTTILKRDSKGNVIHQKDRSGISTSFIYGYNSEFAVAKVVNANPDQIRAVLPELEANLSCGETSLSDQQDQQLRNADLLQDAYVTTYRYKLGVGVSRVTDPTGLKMTYAYDEAGNLKYVMDHDGNILSEREISLNSKKDF